MEEDNMLSLFTGDSADFLDELAQSAQGDDLGDICLSNGADGDLLDSAINDVAELLDPTMQSSMQPQNQQQQASYMMASNMALQQQQQQQQKLQHFGSDFNQFSQQSSGNICHMSDAGVGIMGGSAMMGVSQQQFGSPPLNSVGMAMSNPQASYNVYPVHESPHVTPPRQTTPQPQMWADGTAQQTAQTIPGGGIQVVQQVGGVTNYLSHHDYALPANQQQRLTHYGDQSQQVQGVIGGVMENSSYGMPQLGSPPSVCRLTHMPMSASTPITKVQQQQQQLASCNVTPYASAQQQNNFIGAQTQQPLQHMNYSTDAGLPQSTMQVSAQTVAPPQVLNTYHQGGQPVQSQGTVEAPPLSHFQQCSINQQSLQYQQQPAPIIAANQLRAIAPRPVMQQQQLPQHLQVRTQLAKLPASSSQGNFQQLCQITLSTGSAMPGASASQPAFTNARLSHSMPNYANVAQQPLTAGTPATSTPLTSRTLTIVGQVGGKAGTSQRIIISGGAVITEIQQLQQQIQQLYNRPQTPQTQQKMLDLQERMRTLKAEQQQTVLQQQRLQKQQVVPAAQQHAAKKVQLVQVLQPNMKTLLKQGDVNQQASQPLVSANTSQTVTLAGGQKVMTLAAASQPQQTVTLPGSRQQTVTLAGGQQQTVTLLGGQQQTVTLAGGQQQTVTLAGGQQQTLTLPGGQQQTVTLAGQQQTVTLAGGQQQTLTLAGGQQQTVTLAGGQQQTVTLAGGQQQTVTLSGSQQKFVTIAGGQQKFVTLMGSQQQAVSLAGGQQKLVTLASGQHKVVTVSSGGQQKMVTLAGGQQKIVTVSGSQQKMVTLPGGQQTVLTLPGGQQKVVTVSGSQQKVVTLPGGQQRLVTLSGGQKILTLPSGQQQIVTLATNQPQSQPQTVTLVDGQQKVLISGGTQQRRQITLQLQPPKQDKPATMKTGALTVPQRSKPVTLQPKPIAAPVAPPVAQTITIDATDPLQEFMTPDDDLIVECETIDLDDSDPKGLSPLDTPTLVPSPEDSQTSLSKEQQKANRIIAEAIAKAAAEGKAIPKVVTVVVDAAGISGTKAEKKSKKKKEPRPPKEKKPKEQKPKKVVKSKPRPVKKKKLMPTFLKSKKKRKRNASSDVSDGEPSPQGGLQDIDSILIQKRRSSRQVKRKKYLDDLDLNLSDDDDDDEGRSGANRANESNASFFVENPDEGDAQIVEKILGMRTVTRQVPKENLDVDVDVDSDTNIDDKEPEMEEMEVEEFYVKYKNFSYLHCEWRTADELERGDKRIQMKIKRFKIKKLQQNAYFASVDEGEFFNPEYVEVDRVLEKSVTTDPATDEEVTYYLVKWCSLPYEDSTWELEQDVDVVKIDQFIRFNTVPSEEEREYKEPPQASEWTKLDDSPDFNNGNTLRDYQLEGVNWLTFNYYSRQSCILADEMGLGKTIQSISFLANVVNYGIRGPFLIIVPLSTIANWQREFELWTDLNVIVYHGTTPSRNMIQEYEMYFRDEQGAKIPDEYKFTVLITTFEIIISDCELLSDIDWRVCIIDEAHRLKNKNCKLMEGLKMFDLEHRVLLTGTPLQNNVEELFSLLNFLEPKRFNSIEAFLVDFGDLKSDTQVQKLKALLKPVMLRRLKEDVERTLAPKEETIVEVELTNIQKKYYRAILERNFTFLAKGGTSTNVPNLMNTMMELRKCCNHPFLVAGAEDKIIEEARQQAAVVPEKLFQLMIQSSGKLVLIDKLLPKLKAGDHKVLVFSQMIRVLDILEDYLIQKKYMYERIDGRIRGNLRQEAIDRFSKPDSDRFVFLLCTRAGGLGINLTAADTVIIYDSDWNPQNDLQAQARCHRIGQSKAVKVYRLVTRNSYEREMFDRASMKLGLDKAVLQRMGGKEMNTQQMQLSKKDIEELLKKGAYGAIMDEDNVADQFCEEDIDQILQRRTQVIKIESEGKGSTFSKASFSVSENRTDIDIADPNFWQKWAKKADLDVDEFGGKKELIMAEPRQRKQTTRYGNQDSILDMSELDTSDSEEDAGAIEDVPGRHGTRRRKSGRRGRRMRERHDQTGHGPIEYYTRSDCFKVEKNLLVYGWGRWNDILLHGRFKRRLQVKDVETIARAMLVYSLKHYAGDERIKGFIYDLVTPSADGQEKDYKNHLGLSAPVPRGRKGKKAKKDMRNLQLEENLARVSAEMERIISDDGYKKHLKRHANKVLLRVRLLYYLKQEVIGDEAEKVFSGLPAREVNIPTTYAEGDPPAFWWDPEADRSLLVGVFKHGYEKYNTMRMDPALCFLGRCGAPDGRAVLAEQNDEEDFKEEDDRDLLKGKSRQAKCDDDDDEMSPGSPGSGKTSDNAAIKYNDQNAVHGTLPFPLPSDLNTRLRRVITGYQRSHKREQLKQEQKAKKMERRERFQAVMKEREQRKRDAMQSRWSRREEADFYRVVSTFGVERDLQTGEFRWDTFRSIARLDKKYDNTLTDYFRAFYHMVKRVCRKFKTDEEAIPPNDMFVEPITEERAARCLARIDLLNCVREHTLWHPRLTERLRMCQSSPDMPDWWVNGEHDKDLLIGAAKHGLARTDYHILYDPKLAFREIVMAKMAQAKAASAAGGYHGNMTMPQSWPAGGDSLSQEATTKPTMNVAPSGDTNSEAMCDKTETKCKTETDVKTEEGVEEGEGEARTEGVKVENGAVKEEVKVEESMSVTVKSESSEKSSDGVGDKDAEVATTTSEVETDGFVKDEIILLPEETVEKPETPPKTSKAEEAIKTDSDSSDDELENYGMPPADMSFAREKLDTPQDSTLGDDDTSLDMTIGSEMALDSANQPWNNPFVHWPKDRVIFHRIEQLCYCIDTGEWPGARHYAASQAVPDSRSSTPASCVPGVGLTKLPGTPVGGHDYTIVGTAGEGGSADGLKMTFHKRRKRRKKAEMELERAMYMQEKMMLGSLSDDDSESNLSASIPPDGASGSIHLSQNFGEDREAELRVQAMLVGGTTDQGEAHEKKKRGRKRKIDKWLEGQPDAAAFKQSMALLATMQPDARVPVVHLQEGTRLTGEDAPTRKDLAHWLEEHPGYVEEKPPTLPDAGDKAEGASEVTRKQRRPRIDPSKLDLTALTGDENVSVINRETGKKITGAKAPPLKYLKEWLEKNPAFDIDGKWAHVVAAKGNLPESLCTRVTVPSGRRGRKPANSEYLNSLSSMAALSSSAGLVGYPMGMPFGGLAGFGLANPMYAAATGFGMMPGSVVKPDDDSDTESGTRDAKDASESSSSTTVASAAGAMPHMSFPFVYNPMLFNQVYAQSLGAASYMLPNSMSTFASLARAPTDSSAAKGDATTPVDSDDAEPASTQAQPVAEDLSMKKSTPDGDTEMTPNMSVVSSRENDTSNNSSDSDTAAEPGTEPKDNYSSSSSEEVTDKVQDDSNVSSHAEQS